MHFFRVEDTIKAVQSAGRGRNRERIRVSSMKKMFSKRRLKLADINRSALENPEAFIEEEHQRYSDGVEGLARALAVGLRDRCLVMLSGPSSSGKTTTAVLLTEELRELGLDAHKVSLDDFYCGRAGLPGWRTAATITRRWRRWIFPGCSGACGSYWRRGAPGCRFSIL